MLNGFEEQTQPLNEYEEGTLLPKLIAGLRKRVGKHTAITNKEMVEAMTNAGYKITEVRVRKLINYIRLHHLIPGLLANSDGYYVSDDPAEVRRYIESLRGRENAAIALRVSFERYLEQLVD